MINVTQDRDQWHAFVNTVMPLLSDPQELYRMHFIYCNLLTNA